MKNVLIIGAGVTGCAIARELSKYELNITVLEKELDVACGASKANSGIVHAGEDPMPGTLKAKMNVEGNALYDQLHKELDFPFRRNGSFVLCFDASKRQELAQLKERGVQNGVPIETMHILSREEALQMEPHLSDRVTDVLYLETGGIVSPYELTIALAENAAENGVVFKFNAPVIHIKRQQAQFEVETSHERFLCDYIINAAGIYADEIHGMLSRIPYQIIPRRGEYVLLDKVASDLVDKTLFQLPTEKGKGVLVTPTTHGNVLIGPTSKESDEKEKVVTTGQGLAEIISKASLSIDQIPLREIITSFSGQRAHEIGGDFILGEVEDVPGLINALGIESPGLTSAPAIAVYIRKVVEAKCHCPLKKNFNPYRRSIPRFSEATSDERVALIQKDPHYGTIVCRCETVTEAEIREAIRRPVGAITLDGLKRRTRAGMGRCQCGFCMNRLVEILSEELKVSVEAIRKSGNNAYLLVGDLKSGMKEQSEE